MRHTTKLCLHAERKKEPKVTLRHLSPQHSLTGLNLTEHSVADWTGFGCLCKADNHQWRIHSQHISVVWLLILSMN